MSLKRLTLGSLYFTVVSVHALKCENEFDSWMSFQEAKTFIQTVRLTSAKQFQRWSKSEHRPKNFPSTPQRTYLEEWTNWGDFLGTENISSHKREWMSFQEAKTLMQNQRLRSVKQFQQWKQSEHRPKNFPLTPEQTYKDEWTNWSDFLGTGNISNSKREWMSFQEAKIFIQQQELSNRTEFQKWSESQHRPKNFPSRPDRTYKDKWINWNDFLGIENISSQKRKWMSFQEAKAFIQQQGITTITEFRKWSKSKQRPKNFPSTPQRTYSDEWINWSDFLGVENFSHNKKKWMSFQEAKAFIQQQRLLTHIEFQKWSKSEHRPKNFPSSPQRTYSDEWTSWGDFLGTGNIPHNKKKWMSFQEAKTFIQKQRLSNRAEFQKWSKSKKRPKNFPSSPEQTYKDEWKGWNNFLGIGNTSVQNKTTETHIESEERKHRIRKSNETPNHPEKIKKNEQTGQGELSGIENISDGNENQMSFDEIKTFLQQEAKAVSIHIQSKEEGRMDSKSENISSDFDKIEKKEQIDQGKLETEWMSFEEAKKYVQDLAFEKPKDFIEWLKSDDRPVNFPPNPQQVYSEWTNVKDFLSTETQEYISYKEAKTFAQKLGITSSVDFFETKKNEPDIFPENFPPNPKSFYTNTGEWTGWNDFLGLTDRSDNHKENVQNAEDFTDEELDPEEGFADDF